MNTIRHSAAALGFLLSAFTVTSASAAIITYDFTAAPGVGPLAGNTYSGQFSYDDTTLTNIGVESLGPTTGLLSVSFTFEGTTYVASDDADFSTYPRIGFVDGGFIGLSFVVTNLFSIGQDPGYSGTGYDFLYIGSEPFLTLDAVTYTRRTDGGQAVPEPATLALLGAGLAGLGLVRRRKSRG